MSTEAKQDYSLTTFDYVVVEKEKLLAKLRENRDGHNAIYEAAVSGYWIQAGKVLEEKRSEFVTALEKTQKQFDESHDERSKAVTEKNLKGVGSFAAYLGFNAQWPLTFPTNHLDDYDRVISMLEFSVADKTRLTSSEFNSYVRNDWSWNKNFEETNISYVKAYTGSCIGWANNASGGYISVSGFADFGSSYLTRR